MRLGRRGRAVDYAYGASDLLRHLVTLAVVRAQKSVCRGIVEGLRAGVEGEGALPGAIGDVGEVDEAGTLVGELDVGGGALAALDALDPVGLVPGVGESTVGLRDELGGAGLRFGLAEDLPAAAVASQV